MLGFKFYHPWTPTCMVTLFKRVPQIQKMCISLLVMNRFWWFYDCFEGFWLCWFFFKLQNQLVNFWRGYRAPGGTDILAIAPWCYPIYSLIFYTYFDKLIILKVFMVLYHRHIISSWYCKCNNFILRIVFSFQLFSVSQWCIKKRNGHKNIWDTGSFSESLSGQTWPTHLWNP